MNSRNVLLDQQDIQPRPKVTEIRQTESSSIGIPPYFCWRANRQTSAAELWGSYIKSSALIVVLRILRSLQLWTLRSLQTNDGNPKG